MAFNLPACGFFPEAEWTLVSNREEFVSGLTRTMQLAARQGDYWQARITLHPMERRHAQSWYAALLRGLTEPFYLEAPYAEKMLHQEETGQAPGAPAVAGAGQTGRSLVTNGWAANYQIKAGDWFSVNNGTFEELHLVEQDAVADGLGAATLRLTRSILRSPADGAALRVSNPRAEMILAEPQHSVTANRLRVFRSTFTVREFIR